MPNQAVTLEHVEYFSDVVDRDPKSMRQLVGLGEAPKPQPEQHQEVGIRRERHRPRLLTGTCSSSCAFSRRRRRWPPTGDRPRRLGRTADRAAGSITSSSIRLRSTVDRDAVDSRDVVNGRDLGDRLDRQRGELELGSGRPHRLRSAPAVMGLHAEVTQRAGILLDGVGHRVLRARAPTSHPGSRSREVGLHERIAARRATRASARSHRQDRRRPNAPSAQRTSRRPAGFTHHSMPVRSDRHASRRDSGADRVDDHRRRRPATPHAAEIEQIALVRVPAPRRSPGCTAGSRHRRARPTDELVACLVVVPRRVDRAPRRRRSSRPTRVAPRRPLRVDARTRAAAASSKGRSSS